MNVNTKTKQAISLGAAVLAVVLGYSYYQSGEMKIDESIAEVQAAEESKGSEVQADSATKIGDEEQDKSAE